MFERFTTNMRQAMNLARHEAIERRQSAIGAEHALLAILSIPDASAAEVLRRQGVDPAEVAQALRSLLPIEEEVAGHRGAIPFLPAARRLLDRTLEEAGTHATRPVTTAHLLLAAARETEGIVGRINASLGLDIAALRESAHEFLEDDEVVAHPETPTSPLAAYGLDLVAEARLGKLDPVVGREGELTRCANALARAGDTAVLLVGAPGVGKSAVVDALAHRAAGGTFPGLASIWRLDVPLLIAGTRHRGTLEDRLDRLLGRARHLLDATVLVIDDLHRAVEAGSVVGGGWWERFRWMLKPAIERGEIGMIGVADRRAMENLRARDRAFWACFQTVVVEAPDRDGLAAILEAHATRLRAYHGVSLQEGVLGAVLERATRHFGDIGPARAAIDLLDHTMARARLRSETSVDEAAILAALAEMTGLDEETLRRPEGPPP